MADQHSSAPFIYPQGSFYEDLDNRIQALEAAIGTGGGAVPDYSITNFKIADGAVTDEKIAEPTKARLRSGLSGFRNKIINGGFPIWQRGFGPFSASGYTADRWRLEPGTGSSNSVAAADFIADDTLPFVDDYSLAWTRTAAGSSPSYLIQKIEGARTHAGKLCTLTVWARATVATKIRVSLQQRFGTGGSPSPYVDYPADMDMTFAGGGGLKRFDFLFTLGKLASKTFGTNKDDAVWLMFTWLHTEPNASIAISHVSIVEGDARAESDPFGARHVQQEEALCQRFFERGVAGLDVYEVAGGNSRVNVNFRVNKRHVPSVIQSDGGAVNFTAIIIGTDVSTRGFATGRVKDGGTGKGAWTNIWQVESEL